MSKVIKLTRIFLKSSFSNMDSRMGVSSKSNGKILLYGILFLYFAGLIIFLSYNLLDGLIAIHQEAIFVSLVLFMDSTSVKSGTAAGHPPRHAGAWRKVNQLFFILRGSALAARPPLRR